jgi:hypothetical protein
MGGHVLRETTSRGLCGLGCPSRTSERGGEEDSVKGGGGEEGKQSCGRFCIFREHGFEDFLFSTRTHTTICLYQMKGPWRALSFVPEIKNESPRACVCLLLQDLVQSCLHGGGGIWEDMCYERRRAEACVD